jgi:hypothetical protein
VSRRGPACRPQDVTDSRQGRAIERFWTFIDACEPTRAERRHVAEVVVAIHDWTYAIVAEAAATGHRGFADYWHKVMEPTARAGAGACRISATYCCGRLKT